MADEYVVSVSDSAYLSELTISLSSEVCGRASVDDAGVERLSLLPDNILTDGHVASVVDAVVVIFESLAMSCAADDAFVGHCVMETA